MTIEEIKELLRVFNESGVGELEVQRGDDVLRIRRAVNPQAPPATAMLTPSASTPVPAPPTASPAEPAKSPERTPPQTPAEETTNEVLVKSPIVGTFYESSSPGAPPFVKVGDSVEPGQVLCIIESMKLMNEIEAEIAGMISAKFVETGRPVEYGEALFAIRPRS